MGRAHLRKPWAELTCKQKLTMSFTLASAGWAPVGAIIATVAITGALALLSSVANDVASVGAQFQVCNLIDMDRVALNIASAFALSCCKRLRALALLDAQSDLTCLPAL